MITAKPGPVERKLCDHYRDTHRRIWAAGAKHQREAEAAAKAKAEADATAATKRAAAVAAAKAAARVAVVASPTAQRRMMGYVPSIRLTAVIISERYNVPVLTMISSVRHAPVVRCRQIAMAISCRWHTLTETGRYYHRDHTTVMHSRQVVERRMAQSEDYRREVTELAERIEAAFAAGRTQPAHMEATP